MLAVWAYNYSRVLFETVRVFVQDFVCLHCVGIEHATPFCFCSHNAGDHEKLLYECIHIHNACNSNSVTVFIETNIEPGVVQGMQEQSVSYTKDSYTLLATVTGIVLIQYTEGLYNTMLFPI